MVRMIASWGSSGSGKNVLCVSLASQLAAMNKNTVIICANCSTPALGVFLPNVQIGADQSLRKLLFSPMQSIHALKGYIHIHPSSQRIGFMGLASGETPFDKAFRRDTLMTLLRLLNDSPFDYIIFNCQENPLNDQLTLLALETSEYPIRMITPDVRGMEFEKSHTAWMRTTANMRRPDEHIRVISPARTFSPIDKVISVTGQADYILPFSSEVYSKSIAGQLIIGCEYRDGIRFDNQIRKLAERIVSDERNPDD